jgi:hypothetical protein
MSFSGKKGVDKAFAMLRTLPRVCLANIRRNPGTRIKVMYRNEFYATEEENVKTSFEMMILGKRYKPQVSSLNYVILPGSNVGYAIVEAIIYLLLTMVD